MSEFTFKKRNSRVTIEVKKEYEDGTFDSKELIIEYSPTDYRFAKRAAEATKHLTAALANASDFSAFDDIVKAERMAFECLSPDGFDEFFEFLESDIEDMAALLDHAIHVVRDKIVESKKSSIAPAAPDVE